MARGNLAKNVKYGRIKKGPKRGGKAPAATPKPPAMARKFLPKTIEGLSTGRNFRAIDRGPDFEGLRRAAKKAITKGSKK